MDPVIATLIEYLQYQRHIVDYAFVAAAAVLIYDYALTLPLEIKFVWFSRWSYTKVLFLLVRYTGFIIIFIIIYEDLFLNLSVGVCKVTWPLSSWLVVFRTAFAEAILCLRTWAIWSRHNAVSMVLLIAILAYVSLQCFLNYHLVRSFQFTPPPYSGSRGCMVTGVSRMLLSSEYISLLALEIIVLTLVVVSAFRLYRTGRNSELSFIIHRDGILFYLSLLVLTGTNMIIMLGAPLALVNVMIPVEDVLHSIFTTRIILNIRSVTDHGRDAELHTNYFETRILPARLHFRSRTHIQDQ